MAIQSKYYSTCPLCGKRIKIGDWIDNKNSIGKWAHRDCKTVTDPKAKPANIGSVNVLMNIDQEPHVENKEETFSFPTNFAPSIYQENIFEWIINGSGHGVIEAVAGSGKTTTIVKSLEYLPLALLVELGSVPRPQTYKDLSVLSEPGRPELIVSYLQKFRIAFLAYNKHIKNELKKRAPAYVHVSTLHSLGWSLMTTKFPGIQVDEDKIGGKMDDIYPVGKTYLKDGVETETPPNVKRINKMKRFAMRKIVSLIKSTLTDHRDRNAINTMIEFYGLEIQEDIIEDVLSNIEKVVNRSKADLRSMDYDDLLWLPIVLNLQLKTFHYVLVDEFQDLNNCQIEYVMRSVSDGGRIIGVGDRKQSLYGFRGADIDAIPRMIEKLQATVMPLSISYRCPTTHVSEAQKIVPQLEASPNAIEGLIATLKYKDFQEKIEPGDMVICRTNAPLVKPAFEAIRQGKKAIIRGKDIGKTLVEFIRKFEADSLSRLDVLMAEFTAAEYQRLYDRGKELQADMTRDKYETIKSVSNECRTVQELVSKLMILFDDSNIGIVFSSVHRAKGLEAERVFILRNDLMPHPKAKQSWELTQESNAQYVAYTRSKRELYFVQKEL